MMALARSGPLTHSLLSPAVAQVEKEVEGGVDGDEQVIHAHQDREPLKKRGQNDRIFLLKYVYSITTFGT